jgi:hypothetical protein
MTRKIFTFITAFLITVVVLAQSPQKMSYQAVIRDAGNHLVTTQVGMRISILKGSDVGTAVYAETQMPTPNANGLVTIEIGGGTPVLATFADIDWSAGPYYIKTETDPSGGSIYTITGTSQLLSVPYTLYAKTAGGHFVGELYGGGIVVSVWKNAGVEHGLIASLTDLSAAAPWSDVTSALAGAPNSLDGQANTNAILTQSPDFASAAKLCADYTVGAFSDWYLPAIWELKECYNAEYVVNTILGANDGFKFAAYWSSTEDNAATGWYLLFNTGVIGSDAAKGNSDIVRAIRKF